MPPLDGVGARDARSRRCGPGRCRCTSGSAGSRPGAAFVALACDVSGDHDSAKRARLVSLGRARPVPAAAGDGPRAAGALPAHAARLQDPLADVDGRVGADDLREHRRGRGRRGSVQQPKTARARSARANALVGGYLGSYTGVLLASTAVPLWARSRTFLGPIFVATATATGAAAVRLVCFGSSESTRKALGHVQAGAMAAELILSEINERRLGRHDAHGKTMKRAKWLTRDRAGRAGVAAHRSAAVAALPRRRRDVPLRLGRSRGPLGARRPVRGRDGALAVNNSADRPIHSVMRMSEFRRAGHTPSLVAALLHFDVSFAIWVILGALGAYIAEDLGLTAAEKGVLVAIPLLSAAVCRVTFGILADRFGPRRIGTISMTIAVLPLLWGWLGGTTMNQMLGVGVLLGVAGASFAISLPLASRWYPPQHQGLAMGIAGAGNSGTVAVRADRAAPGRARRLARRHGPRDHPRAARPGRVPRCWPRAARPASPTQRLTAGAFCPAGSTKLKVAGVELFVSGELEGADEVVAARHPRGLLPARGLRGRRARGADRARRAARRSHVGSDRVRLQRRVAIMRSRRVHRSNKWCGRRRPRPAAAAVRRRCAHFWPRRPRSGSRPCSSNAAKAIEVLVRGPVEVGRAGGQQAPLAGGGVERARLLGRVGRVERLDAVDPVAGELRSACASGSSTSQYGCAQTARPPAAWMTSIASRHGRPRAARRSRACPGPGRRGRARS